MLKPQNDQLEARLRGIFEHLWGSFEAGRQMSNAIKGSERELFITGFLSQVFPPHYRFSSGDITDGDGHRSGQIDIVLEFPHGFSFPIFSGGPRLFLAENVAVAIEVKSNLVDQWDEVLTKGKKLKKVHRRFSPQYFEELATLLSSGEADYVGPRTGEELAEWFSTSASVPNRAEAHIPFFAVGFEGWKDVDKLHEKLEPEVVDAIFVIESRLYASSSRSTSGIGSLMMFLERLEQEVLRKAFRLPVLLNYRVG